MKRQERKARWADRLTVWEGRRKWTPVSTRRSLKSSTLWSLSRNDRLSNLCEIQAHTVCAFLSLAEMGASRNLQRTFQSRQEHFSVLRLEDQTRPQTH